MELNERQKRFCNEYIIDLNATQAAIRAGYSEKTARSIGQRLLTNVDIQNYISNLQKSLQEKTEITQERVLQEYSRIAFVDIREFYNANGTLKSIKKLPEEVAAALAGVEIDAGTKKIKRWDKTKALDSICRMLGFNAPDKVANVTTDGKDAPPQQLLSDKQFSQLIQAINEAGTG
jgi:phage terminase small subunit